MACFVSCVNISSDMHFCIIKLHIWTRGERDLQTFWEYLCELELFFSGQNMKSARGCGFTLD